MRKEYADLPDKQKIVYYKRGVVYGIFVVLPILILFGSLLGIMMSYTPASTETRATNSTQTTPIKQNTGLDYVLTLFFIISIAGLLGFTTLGTALGDWVCSKLNLYTDFQLEEAERKVAEIKRALEK